MSFFTRRNRVNDSLFILDNEDLLFLYGKVINSQFIESLVENSNLDFDIENRPINVGKDRKKRIKRNLRSYKRYYSNPNELEIINNILNNNNNKMMVISQIEYIIEINNRMLLDIYTDDVSDSSDIDSD